MSLEQALAENTAAVKELTAALQTAPTGGRKKAATPASGTSESATAASTSAQSQPKTPSPAETPASPTAPAASTVTLKDWTDAFCKLGDTSRAGRDAAVEILKHFGVERASLVKPEKYAEALTLAQAAQAKLDTAPASAQSLV